MNLQNVMLTRSAARRARGQNDNGKEQACQTPSSIPAVGRPRKRPTDKTPTTVPAQGRGRPTKSTAENSPVDVFCSLFDKNVKEKLSETLLTSLVQAFVKTVNETQLLPTQSFQPLDILRGYSVSGRTSSGRTHVNESVGNVLSQDNLEEHGLLDMGGMNLFDSPTKHADLPSSSGISSQEQPGNTVGLETATNHNNTSDPMNNTTVIDVNLTETADMNHTSSLVKSKKYSPKLSHQHQVSSCPTSVYTDSENSDDGSSIRSSIGLKKLAEAVNLSSEDSLSADSSDETYQIVNKVNKPQLNHMVQSASCEDDSSATELSTVELKKKKKSGQTASTTTKSSCEDADDVSSLDTSSEPESCVQQVMKSPDKLARNMAVTAIDNITKTGCKQADIDNIVGNQVETVPEKTANICRKDLKNHPANKTNVKRKKQERNDLSSKKARLAVQEKEKAVQSSSDSSSDLEEAAIEDKKETKNNLTVNNGQSNHYSNETYKSTGTENIEKVVDSRNRNMSEDEAEGVGSDFETEMNRVSSDSSSDSGKQTDQKNKRTVKNQNSIQNVDNSSDGDSDENLPHPSKSTIDSEANGKQKTTGATITEDKGAETDIVDSLSRIVARNEDMEERPTAAISEDTPMRKMTMNTSVVVEDSSSDSESDDEKSVSAATTKQVPTIDKAKVLVDSSSDSESDDETPTAANGKPSQSIDRTKLPDVSSGNSDSDDEVTTEQQVSGLDISMLPADSSKKSVVENGEALTAVGGKSDRCLDRTKLPDVSSSDSESSNDELVIATDQRVVSNVDKTKLPTVASDGSCSVNREPVPKLDKTKSPSGSSSESGSDNEQAVTKDGRQLVPSIDISKLSIVSSSDSESENEFSVTRGKQKLVPSIDRSKLPTVSSSDSESEDDGTVNPINEKPTPRIGITNLPVVNSSDSESDKEEVDTAARQEHVKGTDFIRKHPDYEETAKKSGPSVDRTRLPSVSSSDSELDNNELVIDTDRSTGNSSDERSKVVKASEKSDSAKKLTDSGNMIDHSNNEKSWNETEEKDDAIPGNTATIESKGQVNSIKKNYILSRCNGDNGGVYYSPEKIMERTKVLLKTLESSEEEDTDVFELTSVDSTKLLSPIRRRINVCERLNNADCVKGETEVDTKELITIEEEVKQEIYCPTKKVSTDGEQTSKSYELEEDGTGGGNEIETSVKKKKCKKKLLILLDRYNVEAGACDDYVPKKKKKMKKRKELINDEERVDDKEQLANLKKKKRKVEEIISNNCVANQTEHEEGTGGRKKKSKIKREDVDDGSSTKKKKKKKKKLKSGEECNVEEDMKSSSIASEFKSECKKVKSKKRKAVPENNTADGNFDDDEDLAHNELQELPSSFTKRLKSKKRYFNKELPAPESCCPQSQSKKRKKPNLAQLDYIPFNVITTTQFYAKVETNRLINDYTVSYKDLKLYHQRTDRQTSSWLLSKNEKILANNRKQQQLQKNTNKKRLK